MKKPPRQHLFVVSHVTRPDVFMWNNRVDIITAAVLTCAILPSNFKLLEKNIVENLRVELLKLRFVH